MMSLGAATECAAGMLERGEFANAAEANVAIVRMMGVRIVTSTIPREVRTALRAAVKAGKIGHLPKKGLEPEAFFHPNAKWAAMERRANIAREGAEAVAKVLAPPKPGGTSR